MPEGRLRDLLQAPRVTGMREGLEKPGAVELARGPGEPGFSRPRYTLLLELYRQRILVDASAPA
jgi:hypothetical protein